MATKITAGDVRRLNESGGVEATMVRWSDTGEVEPIPYVLFNDISFDDRDREHSIIISRADPHSLGDADWDNAATEDYEAWAAALTETLSDV
jgi:hypothetical protein